MEPVFVKVGDEFINLTTLESMNYDRSKKELYIWSRGHSRPIFNVSKKEYDRLCADMDWYVSDHTKRVDYKG